MELLSDKSGSVSFGWVGQDVYLCRFAGVVSQSLGARHLDCLQAVLNETAALRYFSDARDLTSYDLLARSAFVRLVLTHRKQFKELVVLTWSEGLSAASHAFASAIGEPLALLTNPAEFDRRLTQAAPRAREVLAADDAKRATARASARAHTAVSLWPARSRLSKNR